MSRSQMAEGLFNALAPSGWRAGSAGTDPGEHVRAEAITVMREIGIDISGHRPKSLQAAMGPDVQLAVGLCAEEACPVIPGVQSLHWPLPDPAARPLSVFRAVRDELSRRVRVLIQDLTGGAT
jgi:arsenate reductase